MLDYLDIFLYVFFLVLLLGWLQGRVPHFLHHNPIFCKVTYIYMLLTWHKNNKISNLRLDFDFQLEEEDIYKKNIATYTPNI